MRRPSQRSIVALALTLVVAASGCAYTTEIRTEPPEADVYVDGRYLGKSPVELEDRSGTRKVFFVEIRKIGFTEVETEIERVYKADAHLILLGAAIFPYFLAGATLEDTYDFKLPPAP